jgi:hypothetical protein
MIMSKTDTTPVDICVLRDEDLDGVTGGELSVRPLGTEQLFWDPMWWQVGATGHLPTVTIGR